MSSVDLESRHGAFMIELRALLKKFNVTMRATDDGEPYGQHSPLIEIEFSDPYASYEVAYIDHEE